MNEEQPIVIRSISASQSLEENSWTVRSEANVDIEEVFPDETGHDNTTTISQQEARQENDEGDGKESSRDDDDELSSSDEEKTTRREHGCCFPLLTAIGCNCIVRFEANWPRVFWFFAGVVGPLWLLIFYASVAGWALSRAEAPYEITLNDKRVGTEHTKALFGNLTTYFMEQTPTVCLRLYESDQQIESLNTTFGWEPVDNHVDFASQLVTNVDKIQESTAGSVSRSENITFANKTDLYEFMTKCGKHTADVLNEIEAYGESLIAEESDLTFSWNRCANGTARFVIDVPWLPQQSYAPLHPAAQKAYFESVWLENFTYWHDKLGQPNQTDHPKLEDVKITLEAIDKATGESACIENMPAGGWFFFTVMTTIGYGNQAPGTEEGKQIIYTAGFLSILIFAGVAGSAGYIMAALYDDMMKKIGLKFMSRPVLATLFWGMLYYTWLTFISAYTTDWKERRLGGQGDMEYSFEFSQGYWFAYISTTTVGLGDIYLEPEVLVTQDLLVFSLLFLIGFVYLAAFLGKLGSYIHLIGVGDGADGRTFVTNLERTRFCIRPFARSSCRGGT